MQEGILMADNLGKKFENVIKKSFLKVSDVSIDRLHDQTNGFRGSQNICDFIVYKKPYEYYIECKSVHGASLPLDNITDTQWNGLLQKSQIEGVFAGIICWWVDKGITKFIPIQLLAWLDMTCYKSIRYDVVCMESGMEVFEIQGKKKRVFFDYNMNQFLKDMENKYGI
jgi:hypothetical protein